MLMKFYYLFKKYPKQLQESKHIAEIWELSVPKPSKKVMALAGWIGRKVNLNEDNAGKLWSIYSHVEPLSQTDSQALKRAEVRGYLLKWKDASIPISLAIYVDILHPLKQLSLSFQQELHDPVEALCCIQDFNLTMVKLKLLEDKSLVMINWKKLFQDVEKKDDSCFLARNKTCKVWSCRVICYQPFMNLLLLLL